MSQAPLLLAAVALLTGPARWVAAADWSYSGPNGPSSWGGVCKEGTLQSPIDLDASVALGSSFEPLALINYDQESAVNITNNGHTVQLTLAHQCLISIAAGGLPGVYHLSQIHFHWESEHTLRGERWPLEVHLVHYNRRYSSFKEAVRHRRGLAVIAILFHPSELPNKRLEPLLTGVLHVHNRPGSSSLIPTRFSPQSFLPRDISHFYRYEGSLTTPGCDETVVWTVMTATEPISSTQVAQFQRIMSAYGPLKSNYRPLQDLNNRPLYLQSGHSVPGQGSSNLSAQHIGVFLVLCVLLFQIV